MENRFVLALLGVLVLGSGVAMAISAATSVNEIAQTRWNDSTSAASVVIEGGNISNTDVNGTSLTERWASFWGNVTGNIQLTDGTNFVYQWTWNGSSGGVVCLSQNNAFPFADTEVTTAAEIDTAFGFTGGADRAADTYTDATYPLTIADAAPVTSTGATLMDLSSFDNIAIGDGVETAEDDFAFCTDIDDLGTNYANVPAQYEIMVPTTDTAGATETYYFYVELA